MLSLQLRRSLLRRRLPTILLGFLLPAIPLFAKSGTEREPNVLVPHQPAYFHASAGLPLELALDVKAGHAAEVLIETSAPAASFVVLTPSGQRLKEVSAGEPGWVAIPFQCSEPGRYRLVLQPQPTQEANRGTSLRADFVPVSAGEWSRDSQASSLFDAAQLLAGSPQAAPLHRAIDRYRQAALAWSAAGDGEGQILALAGEAGAWLNLSQYVNALAALKRAERLSSNNRFFRAWLAKVASEIYLDRWDSGPAMRSARQALAPSLSGELADPWLRAEAFACLGEAEYLTGNQAAAREDTEKALTISGETDAGATRARALRCLSWMEGDEGRVTHAMALMRQAEEKFRSAGRVRDAADAMANLATIQGMRGDHFAALGGHFHIQPLIRDSGKTADLAFLLVNLANDYLQLNSIPDAIVYYREAVRYFREIGLVAGESMAVSQLCAAELRAGHLPDALQDCSRSNAITAQVGDPKRLAVTILRLGAVQRAMGNITEAIGSFRKAFDISTGVKDRRSQAEALMDWGDVLEDLGDHAQARQKFEQALPLSRDAEDVPEQIEARFRIARSAFETNEDESAEANLVEALKSIDAQRRAVGNPDLQASYFAQLRKCHELYVELLMREHEHDPSSGATAKALEISESGRALTLLGALSSRRQAPTLPDASIRPQNLLEMQIAIQRAYDQRLELLLQGGHRGELDANEAVLTDAIDTLERAEDEHRSAAPAESSTGTPLSASAIAEASRSIHTTLVEYALGGDHSYVWVVDDGKVESHVLPSRKIIEAWIKQWRILATARIASPGNSDRAGRIESADVELNLVGGRLSCMLIAPFLRPHMDRLAIVPDGELYLLPFAALPENGCNGGAQPLVVNRQIVTAPSLSILLVPHSSLDRNSWRGEVALLADPVFDAGDSRVHLIPGSKSSGSLEHFGLALARLYGTRDEAKAIAALAGPNRSTLYLDFDASVQNLLKPSLGQYRILHLATHGVFDGKAPALSGIVLSRVDREGRPVFGYLQRRDVENLDLRSDLVVLNACNSGEGPNLSGEGVTGLNHAFLSAGATRVLSTLWSVDDEVSKELMDAFYKGILVDHLVPAEALHRSQLELLHNRRTAPPYYWAGFSITTTAP